MPNRRQFLLTLLATGGMGLGAGLLRPGNQGSPHSVYFKNLEAMLKREGIATPTMVIDLDRLDRNIDRLQNLLPAHAHYRIVAKSLPSPELIQYVMARTGTRKVMVFHQPFLNRLASLQPDVDMLLGKPMPVLAAARFYQELATDRDSRLATRFNPETQLQWLVDTPARLRQYGELASSLQQILQINLEIDVGLHRGGINNPQDFQQMLQYIQEHPRLQFAGLMGYDAHIGKIPRLVESPQTSLALSQAVYREYIQQATARFGEGPFTYNGAGSLTFALHREDSPLNDISAGSCLVKPLDFETPLLESFEPAAFIATPVLKAIHHPPMPGADWLGDAWPIWDRNREYGYFFYGGNWMARPVSPKGLVANPLYGKSSNQALLNGSAGTGLTVDDTIFFRPSQSEAVFLQFQHLLATRKGRLEQRWATL